MVTNFDKLEVLEELPEIIETRKLSIHENTTEKKELDINRDLKKLWKDKEK